MGHAPEHGEHAVEELEGLGHVRLLDIAPGKGDAESSAELVSAPGGDPPRVSAVPSRAPPALRKIQGNGAGRTSDLLGETAVPDADPGERPLELPHEIETDFQSFEHMP